MSVSTFAINNLTVTQNHGNTIITAENMYRGGTHSVYAAQVLAIGKGVYTFVECQFHNEQTDAAYDGKPAHGTFSTLQAAAQAAFDFIVAMVTKIENAFTAGYPVNKIAKVSSATKNYNYSKQNLACLALKAFAEAANEVLHIMIAEQAELQSEVCEIADAFAELDLVPDNADTELEYEALRAGAAFDNAAPIAISKHYDLSGDIDELNETIDTIAIEQADDLAAIDSEIAALKARLLALGSTRQDIVEEYAHWHQVAQAKIDVLEYRESQDANEAYDDLRQLIWFSTGQDIM